MAYLLIIFDEYKASVSVNTELHFIIECYGGGYSLRCKYLWGYSSRILYLPISYEMKITNFIGCWLKRIYLIYNTSTLWSFRVFPKINQRGRIKLYAVPSRREIIQYGIYNDRIQQIENTITRSFIEITTRNMRRHENVISSLRALRISRTLANLVEMHFLPAFRTSGLIKAGGDYQLCAWVLLRQF